jgi:magnesium-transporting ATPase (P-type)
MGTVTLGVLTWAWGEHGELVARTMGLTTFLIAIVLLSFESREQRRSMFSLHVLGDRTFLIATGISVGLSTWAPPFPDSSTFSTPPT